ncbi:MAG: CRISPR-associated endonuclease Cas1 [Armatimonadota bacterium]
MSVLIVSEFGVYLGKHSERLVIRKGGETVEEHPLIDLEQVLVTCPGISVSSDLIRECCERGIAITFLSYSGTPYAKVVSPALTATIQTRRDQISAFNDTRGVYIGKAIAGGKLKNQANLLRYFAKYRKQSDASTFEEISTAAVQIMRLSDEMSALIGADADSVRTAILNLEGRGGALYWNGVKAILGEKAEFKKREHRGSVDPVNSILNYGYGILYSQVWSAVILAGLEPFAGFIHVDRPGRPSLVLDMMEEFRQPVVDRALLAAIGRGFKVEMETPEQGEEIRLSQNTRQEVANRVLERLDSKVTYEGKKWTLKSVIQMQCRRLASFLRREGEYKPFVSGW